MDCVPTAYVQVFRVVWAGGFQYSSNTRIIDQNIQTAKRGSDLTTCINPVIFLADIEMDIAGAFSDSGGDGLTRLILDI